MSLDYYGYCLRVLESQPMNLGIAHTYGSISSLQILGSRKQCGAGLLFFFCLIARMAELLFMCSLATGCLVLLGSDTASVQECLVEGLT